MNTLSHVRPASLVTLGGHHVITASKVLSGDVSAADLTAQLVNGVRLTADTVLIQGRLPGQCSAGAGNAGMWQVTRWRG